ncbi:G-type lectin S-receptor-like serine/threonine-protein kinase At2g19130 [Cryptomeria japonica]|uniref:G-type lectin S-receptor-like serine/threonine-protein kinase At2g19130 n=1 Tax=Cryptomeria japonica TaxID=3369 RepID=UPI0027DAAC07|nr:G-type lectin S-receptor-like serine/threonine-protein kinase At2g19130 [Cryptomeria japonica]XP_057834872.2 G-type lectin S-receptor-like serine/threonine-protein kinase At2g19130 [Cryptomeria japonica]
MALLNWDFLVPTEPTTGMLAFGMPTSLRRLSFGWLTERLPSATCPAFLRSLQLVISLSLTRKEKSSNNTQHTKGSRASILDTGNFVLFGAQNTSEIVWESFGDPTDTRLPTMKFWKGLKLKSWKSSVDPAPGPFFQQMNPSPGKTDLQLQYKNIVPYYSTGEWTGSYFTNLPGIPYYSGLKLEFEVFSPTRMYYTYKLGPQFLASTMMMRHVLKWNGELLIYTCTDNNSWSPVWYQPQSSCGVYGVCGPYGVCFTQENIESCRCMEGFHPRNAAAWSSQEWWSSGCVRRTPLNCAAINGSGTTDGFLQVTDKSLSDKEPFQIMSDSTLLGCKTACLNNCSCTAFAFTVSNSHITCKLWFGDLLSMRTKAPSDSQLLFIRLAASDVLQLSAHAGRSSSRAVALSISIPLGAAVLSSLFIGACFIHRRRRKMLEKFVKDYASTSLRTFTYKELKVATKNFVHKLGKGAFGCVFKATLLDKTLVAVKKLEGSAQAEKQFRAEISTIGNIHHVNLVKLRGFCVEGSTRMLVYEYMENGSLNSFLSSKSKEEDKVLDWNTRYGIALGTARGLLYLHEECRDRIIHCDIKPENILLDADFSPKVADFGLAKLVGRDFSRVLTTTRGTIGYLAPEWLTGVPITVKVDVYSFGMTLLEIISGRRNSDLSVQESQRYFPTWAATQILKGNTIGIVDERITDGVDVEEVIRAVVVSILCIQEDENGRPTMAQVVQILEGKSEGNMEKYERCLQALIDDHCVY